MKMNHLTQSTFIQGMSVWKLEIVNDRIITLTKGENAHLTDTSQVYLIKDSVLTYFTKLSECYVDRMSALLDAVKINKASKQFYTERLNAATKGEAEINRLLEREIKSIRHDEGLIY